MNKPEFITFTGVDAFTDRDELMVLASKYPIELGILFSPKRQGMVGENRYPPISYIEWLFERIESPFSAHLCGGHARSVIEQGMSQHDSLIARCFDRCQINTTKAVLPSIIATWAAKVDVRPILQCRGDFPPLLTVDLLFDQSGGRGVIPTEWPKARVSTFCGYAGGLNPQNVARAVETIGKRAAKYWIDMESGVRDTRDRFDLRKVRAVCEAVYGKKP